ncbi:hypothetical protein QQ045_013418 [Rhodiola kirilowii]
MDWFAWLSQTQLQPSLIYNYGVLFACNELTLNDVAYFDHDFLLSMGVKIGKHRLEILKLARAESTPRRNGNTLSVKRFIKSVSESARRGLARCVKKLTRRKEEPEALSFGRKLSPLKVDWKEIKEDEVERRSGQLGFLRSPGTMAESGENTTKSGPLRVKRMKGSSPVMGPRKYVSGPINGGRPVKAQSPRFSGPLDGTKSFCKSPRLSGQLDGCYGSEPQSPWAMLFEDLRPN